MSTLDATRTQPGGSTALSRALPRPLRALVATDADAGPLILRLTLALVILPHGLQKTAGWFGGYGFGGTMQYFTETLGIPAFLALLVILAELLGPIGLAAGLLSRVAALGIGAVMVGAIFLSHLQHGFFMNWSGAQGGEGIEYHLLVLGIVVVLLVKGSGALSLDRRLTREEARRR